MTATLIIGHGNGHNEPQLEGFVRDADADSCAALESQRVDLDSIRGHRVTRAGEAVDPRARATSIVTSNRRRNIGELTRQVSEEIPGLERVAPDRTLVVSMYEHPVADAVGREGVAHMALHPDAGPRALRGELGPKHPIVREYVEAWVSTLRFARALRADGLLIVITTDAQMFPNLDVTWNPRLSVAKPLKLEVHNSGIDWLMYDRRLQLTGWREVDLFDHDGFVAQLSPRERAKR